MNNVIPLRAELRKHDDGEAGEMISLRISSAMASAVDSAALWAGKSRDQFLQELLNHSFPEARS
jgi:hypothetical protein